MKTPLKVKTCFSFPAFLFFALYAISLVSIAQQNPAIDSLKQIIANTKVDTAKVWTLCELGFLVEASDPDEAYTYYKQAEAISRKANYPAGIVKSIFNFCYILDLKSRFSESKKYYEEAVEISKTNKLGMMEGSALLNYGNWYYKNKDLRKAMELYIDALKIYDQYPENPYSETIRVNMGNLYVGLNRYEEAIKLSNTLLPQLEGQEEKTFAYLQVLGNLGDAYKGQRKWKEAITAYEKLRAIAEKNDIKELMANSNNSLATLYRENKDYNKIYQAAFKALQIGKELDDQLNISFALGNIGHAYFYQNQPDSALHCFLKAYEIINKNELNEERLTAEHNLEKAYLLKGDIRQYQVHKNKADSLEALQTAKESFESANEIEAKYELQKKENEILQKDLELSQTRNRNTLLTVGLSTLLVLAGFAFYSYRKNQQNLLLEEQVNSQKRERQRIASELHDEIGGNLTSMMYMAVGLKNGGNIDQKADKIIQISGDISASMNEIIWSMTNDQSSMEDWLLFVKARLSDMLENANLAYAFELNPAAQWSELSANQKRNIYLILKEALNNAIRHSGAEEIFIKLSPKIFMVKDNGNGFSKQKEHGNGLQNMKNRTQKMGWFIEWVENHGTEVRLTLPN